MTKIYNKYRKNADYFWNNHKNIKWFKEEAAPQYWIDFFENNQSSEKKVLDLGCGAGRNTEVLFKLGYDVFGCDLYKNMVSTTKKRLIKSGIDRRSVDKRITQGDMLNINFSNSHFDIVLSNGVFHNTYNLNELNLAIEEASRVIKKGGFFCFNMFSSECTDTFKKIGNSVYLTKENLIMTLISSHDFEKNCLKYRLKIYSPIVEYLRDVSTGTRSVMRGVMVKI